MNMTVLHHRSSISRRPRADTRTDSTGLCSAAPAAADHAPASMPELQSVVDSGAGHPACNAAALRTALLVGSVVAVVVAWLAASGVARAGEPELAMLLRGMAAIKGLLALSAAGLVWWRLGQPLPSRVAATYIVCVCALFASTALIWQLAFIVFAAVLFHAAGLVGLVLALREGR